MPSPPKEMRPLMVSKSDPADEKYASKSPFNTKKGLLIFGCLVAVVVYFANDGWSWSTSSSTLGAKDASHHEIHQAIHTATNSSALGSSTTATNKLPTTDNVAAVVSDEDEDDLVGDDDEAVGGTASASRLGDPGKAAAGDSSATSPASSTKGGATTKKAAFSTATMMQNLAVAREELATKMRLQYGSYYESIFFEKGISRGRTVFTSGDLSSTASWLRFQRKLMMKLLTVQTTATTTKTAAAVPFVWATGGHSATAGHGNFYDESYTSYLEQAAQNVFRSVGMKLTGRNYAMGGTAAAPEVALCAKEIFGQDIDVLVWDFGMTDGGAFWKQMLYHLRAGLLDESRPLNIAYHAGGSNGGGRVTAVKEIENMGLAAMISSDPVMDAALAAVPDSFGLTGDEIDQLPEFVRNFRCGKQIENGDPYCKEEKFNLTLCPERKFQTSWHPGWKWQAVMGNLAAFFLIEVLDDALTELAAREAINPSTLLVQLKGEEDTDYAKFIEAPVPNYFQDVLPPSGVDGFDVDLFVKGHNFCHTARLPAESRHKGILTESSKTGFTTYDKGIGLREASSSTNEGEQMMLVYSEEDRQVCPLQTNMDYKDYFYVNAKDDWKKLVLPNDAELKEYGNGKPLQGLVAMCFTLCPWGKCPNGVLDRSAFPSQFELEINGLAVSELREFQECEILRHEDGFKWQPNSDGRFDIRARVTNDAAPGSYVRLSAFIVW